MANQQTTLQKFLTGKLFVIPEYQRGYAWKDTNVKDLFDDIQEAIKIKLGHYIGTVVLTETKNKRVYSIVDGQQRITTIIMLMNAIVNEMDSNDKDFNRRLYIKNQDFVLTPLKRDSDFFFKLLENQKAIAENKSQRLMADANEQLKKLVLAWINANAESSPSELLEAILDLSILEFIEEKDSDAIRIFETVNDRGVPLFVMDKVKSKLFYFSNKYLERRLDDLISLNFGKIFISYDSIKEISGILKIEAISNIEFIEDNFLRHHYICFSDNVNDPTNKDVMNGIKQDLDNLRRKEDFVKMEKYISDYTQSLQKYMSSFEKIMIRTQEDSDYYKLFKILGLAASFYPVITQLQSNDLLDEILPNRNITVLQMIMIIDVRLFKIRNFRGTKDIGDFAYELNSSKPIEYIESALESFCDYDNSYNGLVERLNGDMYRHHSTLLKMLFITYCEELRERCYSVKELQTIMEKNIPTIEHIIPQELNIRFRSYGFRDKQDFEEHKNKLGNLTLLTRKENSSAGNQSILNKLDVYNSSKFLITQTLAAKIGVELDNTFKKKDIDDRTKELAQIFAERWK